MKKFISLLIVFVMLFSFTAYADEEVSVVLNGEKLEFDVNPTIINDRTMVPMRKIFESFGAKVEWVEASQMIFATKGAKCILLQIDVPKMAINNFATEEITKIDLDTAPLIKDDRTLVPLRAISESLDMDVQWEESTYTVYLTSKEEQK